MGSTRPSQSRKIEQTPCLPEQVIIQEILPRLPVNSLLKFSCVSKSWCSLIGSKAFIKTHLKFSINTSNFAQNWIFFDAVEKGFKQCSLPSLFNNPLTDPITCNADLGIDFKCAGVSPMGSCNGIICILIDSERFILWNPATRKFKNVPDFNSKMSQGTVTKYGFGFDELSDDYKVFGIVSVFCVTGAPNYPVGKFYSLRTNSWKDIEERDVSPVDDAGVFVNGKLHWYRIEGCKCYIVSFDLNSHVYGVVELPSYTKGVVHSLGVVGGCLSAHFRHPNGDLDVWLMKEYGAKESWNKVAIVPYYDDPDYREIPIPIAIGLNGEVLLVYDSTVVIYNPKCGVFRHPQVSGLDDMFACMYGYLLWKFSLS